MLLKNAGLNFPSRNIQIRKSLTRSDNRQTYNFETLIIINKGDTRTRQRAEVHEQTSMKMSITNFRSKKWFGFTCCLSMKTTKHALSNFSSTKNPTLSFYIERKMLFVFVITRRDDFWYDFRKIMCYIMNKKTRISECINLKHLWQRNLVFPFKYFGQHQRHLKPQYNGSIYDLYFFIDMLLIFSHIKYDVLIENLMLIEFIQSTRKPISF